MTARRDSAPRDSLPLFFAIALGGTAAIVVAAIALAVADRKAFGSASA